MNRQQIEFWVLDVVRRLEMKAPVEDARVELKAEWPANHSEAARRIAGHANAARGADILWVIGLDESRGIVGVQALEVADWMAQVRKNFDSVAPDLEDVNVPVGDKTVVALLFKTDRAPFVVRNAAYGKQGGGAVTLETPWREGTAVRSATRHDLMRLLAPLTVLPEVECLSLRVHVVRKREVGGALGLRWELEGELFVAPNTTAVVTFPKHKTEAILHHTNPESGVPPLSLGPLTFYLHDRIAGAPVNVHQAGVSFSSAGSVFFSVDVAYRGDWIAYTAPRCEVTLAPVGAVSPIRLDLPLIDGLTRHPEEASWLYAR